MHITDEYSEYPSLYQASERAPSIDWYEEDEIDFLHSNFDLIRTDFNQISFGTITHRVSLLSNHTEEFFSDLFENLWKMVGRCRERIFFTYNFTVLMKREEERGYTTHWISHDDHREETYILHSKHSFDYLKDELQTKFNVGYYNRFKEEQPISILRNMLDRLHPDFRQRMGRAWEQSMLPVAMNISIRAMCKTQYLPILLECGEVDFTNTPMLMDPNNVLCCSKSYFRYGPLNTSIFMNY